MTRTDIPFERIDSDGNGRVNRREFDAWYAEMKDLGPDLEKEMAEQHGFKKGDYVRWVGKFEAPWRPQTAKFTKVIQLGRDLRGQPLALVESEGDVGPNVTDNSFPPRYKGRRVKV